MIYEQDPNVFQDYREMARECLQDTSWAHDIYLEPNPSAGRDDFEDLTDRLKGQFICGNRIGADLAMEQSTPLASGFTTVGYGLYGCVSAYARSDFREQQPSAEQCHSGLVDNRTARFFGWLAGMQSGKNRELELWLGLQRGFALSDVEFEYDQEEGYFKPKEDTFKHAKLEAIGWALNNGQPTELKDDAPNQCPFKIFVPTLWEIASDAALQSGLIEAAIKEQANSEVASV